MDIGKFKNNYIFYTGYEGEGEVILKILNHPKFQLHIWEGYFENIFGSPILINKTPIGFTRDYLEGSRTFSGDEVSIENPQEYLTDLNLYKNKELTFCESLECLNLLIDFFTFAISNEESTIVIYE